MQSATICGRRRAWAQTGTSRTVFPIGPLGMARHPSGVSGARQAHPPPLSEAVANFVNKDFDASSTFLPRMRRFIAMYPTRARVRWGVGGSYRRFRPENFGSDLRYGRRSSRDLPGGLQICLRSYPSDSMLARKASFQLSLWQPRVDPSCRPVSACPPLASGS